MIWAVVAYAAVIVLTLVAVFGLMTSLAGLAMY